LHRIGQQLCDFGRRSDSAHCIRAGAHNRGEWNAAADHWSGWAHRALDVDELHGADLLVLRHEYVDLRVPAAGVVTSDGTAA
jgi:hypothetical protein